MEEFNLLICGQILLLLLTRRRWHRARVPLCADRCRYREHLAGTSTNQHYLVPEYLEPRLANGGGGGNNPVKMRSFPIRFIDHFL